MNGTGKSWATTALFLGLFGLAGAVFFVLPTWVEERNERDAAAALAAEEAREAEAAATEQASESESTTVRTAVLDEETAAESVAPTPVETAAPAPPPPLAPPPPIAPPDDGFTAEMSAALGHLERRDWSAATASSEAALAIRPQAPEALDALVRAQSGLRVEAIQRHTAKAQDAAAQEDWKEAAAQWSAVLAIDPAVEQARRGRAQTLEWAEIEEKLAFHLQNPQRLGTPAVLADAERWLGRAATASGVRIREHAEELAAVVERWAVPVKVDFRSDGLTDVSIYRVGALGKFEQRALDLRPGTYTVVGKRSGFRDVRTKLVISPGDAPDPFLISCSEAI